MTARILITILIVFGFGSFIPFQARAQAQSSSGLRPILPVIPPAPARDLESKDRTLPAPNRGPVSELLESTTSGDAIIEVIVGQARVLTTNGPIAREGGIALVAAGDPTIVDFEVAGPRLVRILGRRVGVTDLSITTDAGQTYTFDVHVLYDLPLLTAYLQQLYPDAQIELKQLREHIVLQGQARSVEQISQIVQTLQLYLSSAQVESQVRGNQDSDPEQVPVGADGGQPVANGGTGYGPGPTGIDSPDDRGRIRATFIPGQIINLMRVPGVHQVMLKVQIAELNRTAFRRIGADMLWTDGNNLIGTTIAGSSFNLFSGVSGVDFNGTVSPNTTGFGIFDNGQFNIILSALRQNGVANILAEPNLMAMNGQEASFLAGGEFPYPVPQSSVSDSITVQFKQFGVLLNFVPTILDDESIRLRVRPEVSNLDFANSVLVSGTEVPALTVRRVDTSVELKQGQTLALAGLLQVDMAGTTNRIPGLGDLPYLGPFFSNTTHERVEKELLVMVTPYLVSPMDGCQVPPLPGSEILDPNCCEFYFMNRIEGRTGTPYRSPTSWDDPCEWRYRLMLEHRNFCGPIGYSE